MLSWKTWLRTHQSDPLPTVSPLAPTPRTFLYSININFLEQMVDAIFSEVNLISNRYALTWAMQMLLLGKV